MIALALVLAAAQLASGAAPVSSDPPRPSAAKAAKVSDKNAMVCRSTMVTGHHIVDRECHTQSDWDRMEAAGKAYADRLTRPQNACAGFDSIRC